MIKNRKGSRKLISLFLGAILVCGSFVTSFAGMSNFTEVKSYPGFSDVKSNSWYYSDVSKSCKLGLFNGYPEGKFKPDGNITLAEAIKVAAVVRATYDGETPPTNSKSGMWYAEYVSYAKAKGIIGNSDFSNYDSRAKRNEMAYIFSKALPESEYSAINSVSALPDVTSSTKYGSSIFTLYKAGILRGNDNYGTFRPSDNINRAEASAIINRVAQSSNRVKFTLAVKSEPPASGGVMTETQTVAKIQNYINSFSEQAWLGRPLTAKEKTILSNIKADPKNCYYDFNSVGNFNQVKNGGELDFYGEFIFTVLNNGGEIGNYDDGQY